MFWPLARVVLNATDVATTRLNRLEELAHDVRYALRVLRRAPGVTTAALVVLGLGIGATTVMFTLINSVVLAPLPFPQPERLLTVHGATDRAGEFWGFSNPDFEDLTRQSRSLVTAAWRESGGTISDPGDPEYVDAREVSANLFAVLQVSLVHGRAFRADEDRPGAAAVAVIGTRLWQRRYGSDPAAIGRRLVFDGKSYTVVGIAPDGFDPSGDVDVFTPLGQNTDLRMQNRQARFLHVLARLRDDAGIDNAQAEIRLIGQRLAKAYPRSNAGVDMLVRPLQDDIVGDIGSTLWLLLAAVAAVLVIACVNIASLLLARAASREREFATRAALGAGRYRLVRQCLTESAVLAAAGGLLGAFAAVIAVRPLLALWPGTLPRAAEVRLDMHVWLFTVAVSVLSSVLFGLAPVLRMGTSTLERALRTGVRTIAGRSHALHSALVIAEVALAVVLLVSAGILGRALLTLSTVDPGLNVRNVLTGRLALSPAALANPDQIRAAWQDVLDRARRVPGVEAAALADIVPMRGGVNPLPYSITPQVANAAEGPVALTTTVTPDYLTAIGLPLRRGRFFDERDRADSEPVVVIDETLSHRAFGDDDPVGKQLWVPALGPVPVRIVGVVGHVRHWGLAGDDNARLRDQMYYPFAQIPGRLLRLFSSFMSVVVRTQVPPATIEEPLRRELRGAADDQALYAVRTMEQVTAASLDRQQFLALLFAIFAGLALLLACVGIYGVLSYVAGLRIPEFGVRMALGATSRSVLNEVLRHSGFMIAVGVVIGASGAWAAARSIARIVEGVRPADAATVTVMTLLLVGAALLASLAPARRVSRLDPLQALRQE